MSLFQLAYVSSAVRPFTDEELVSLLTISRRNNTAANVTGMLLYWDGNFMQALEGEEHDVTTVHSRITNDPRHHGLITLLRGPIGVRTFGEWSMGFRNLNSPEIKSTPGYTEFLNVDWREDTGAARGSRALQLMATFRKGVR